MTKNTKNSPVSLSMMMFLQYAVWGVWLPYLANYLTGSIADGGLGFSGAQVGWILGLAGSIGAVSAPFLAGQIADRFIDASKYLGILLILGGIAKFATFYATSYNSFLVMSIIFSVMYMPTLALTNSIAFAHLKDPEGSFPRVRVWGTIGWIVASTAFPLIWLQTDITMTWVPWFFEGTPKEGGIGLIATCLQVSGVISVLYGLWAIFFLPSTPPTRNVEHPLAFLGAFKQFMRPDLAVLALAALLISMVHQIYFIRTGPFLEDIGFPLATIGGMMAIGQIFEIGVLAVLGWMIARLGFKWTIAVGCLAYVVRWVMFAIAANGSADLVYVGIALHGFCYACFFAASFIFVERVATSDIRHSMQTVYGIIILGIGPIIAGFYNGSLDAVEGWANIWWIQAGVTMLPLLLVALLFRYRKELTTG
ncbi:MAG: hypothetical protein HOC27_03875 [Phycisphaerae bacterium]|jgi:nucleoside transporter|nr:hypothetical protein [Phycisphaerae bacterium]